MGMAIRSVGAKEKSDNFGQRPSIFPAGSDFGHSIKNFS